MKTIDKILNKEVSGKQVIIFGILMACAGLIVAVININEITRIVGIIATIAGAYLILLPIILSRQAKTEAS